MKLSTRLFLGMAVMAVTTMGAMPAHAGFIVTIYSPDDPVGALNPVVVTDNGALDSAGQPNQISYVGSVGNSFPVTLTIATANAPGAASGAFIETTSIAVTNASTAVRHLLIDVTSTGFTTPSGLLTLTSFFSGNGLAVNPGDDANFQSFADAANNAYGNDLFATSSVAPFNSIHSVAAVHTALQDQPLTATGAFSTATATALFNASLYSLTNYTTITMSPGSQLNVSGTTFANAVPEPASLGLLAMGGVMFFRRRR